MIYFTSDQHFGHANVIKYCKRPFENIEQMREGLIQRHNSVVKDHDVVFHLGDFSMHPRELPVLKLLNGRHHLVAGNHDDCHPARCKSKSKNERMIQLYMDAGFSSVTEVDRVVLTTAPFETVRMCHLPYRGDHTDMGERYVQYRPHDDGLWLLHGHVHEMWKVKGRMINVGVDVWDYTPVSLDVIKNIIRGGMTCE